MENKKMLVLGRSLNTINQMIVKKAREMGIYTYVVCFKPETCWEKDIADEYWVQDLYDKDLLIKNCREKGIDGIYGQGDTLGSLALEISKELGIRYYCDAETWHYGRNKADFKKKCKEYGVRVARDYFFSEEPTEEEISRIEFPVVVKPIDCSGNVGISYCYNKEDFVNAYIFAKQKSASGKIVVEKMLQGKEYGAFYACANGELRLLNFWVMLSQPGTPANCYAINSSVTDNLHKYLQNVNSNVKNMLQGIGVRDGVVWLELMEDTDGEIYAIEMGHRLSGEMMWVPLADVTGFDALEWMIKYTVNGRNDSARLPVEQTDYYEKCACGYILWTRKEGVIASVEGVDAIKNSNALKLFLSAQPGVHVDAFKYGSIVTLTAKNCDEMCEKIKFINDTFNVKDVEGSEMFINYDNFDFLKELDSMRN